MAVDTSRFRNGLKIEINGEPFTITYFQHVKPGKGGAFVRTKIKNLKNGRVIDKTFRSGEKVDEADIDVEPLILICLGLVVGFIALSLFIPLFDLTAMAGQ